MPTTKRRDLIAEGQRILRATLARADRRLMEAIKATKAAGAQHRVAQREAERLYHEAQCHPDMPKDFGDSIRRRLSGQPQTAMSRKTFRAADRAIRKVWHQIGYDVAAAERSRRFKIYARALKRVFRPKPATLKGAVAKTRLLAATDPEILNDVLWKKSPLEQIAGDLNAIERRAA